MSNDLRRITLRFRKIVQTIVKKSYINESGQCTVGKAYYGSQKIVVRLKTLAGRVSKLKGLTQQQQGAKGAHGSVEANMLDQ